LTMEICNLAVLKDSRAIQYVPEKFMVALCRQAVERNGWAINCISERHRTEELWRIAISKSWSLLKELPASLMSEEFCRLAVSSCGKALEYVPDKYKTKELCFAAVKQDGHALKFVDVSKLTKEEYSEICRLSLERKS